MNFIKAGLILHTILSLVYSTKHTSSFHHKLHQLPSPSVLVASKDLDLSQGDTPLIVTGVIPKSFSLDTIPSILETYFTSQSTNGETLVRVDITPLAYTEAPIKLSNGTIISPYQLGIPINETIPLFTASTPIERGYNAYIRLLNLQSHPKLTTLLPLARLLHLAGSNLISANLWLGDGSIKSAIHYDGQDNLLLQLSGTKTVLLIPPELEPYMQYKKYTESQFVFDETTGKFVDEALKSTSKIVENHGTFDLFSSSDHEQEFDFITGSRAMICTLHQGETLFLPALWSHAVVSSTGLNAAVNLWFTQKSVSHRKALERHPSWSAGHFLLGNDLLAQHRYTEAEIAYRKSLEIESDNFDASHNLASTLEGKGERTAAINQYREAFALHRSVEEGVQCLTNIGVILKKRGDLDEAEIVCKEAVELDPKSGKAWKIYGNVLALLEKFEAADEALGTAVKLLRSSNDKVAALNSWGVVLEQLPGRKQDAIAAYEQALRIDPSYQKARDSLDNLISTRQEL